MKKTEDSNNNDLELKEIFSNVRFSDERFVNRDKVGRAILEHIAASRRRSVRRMWMAAASVTLALICGTTYFLSGKEYVSEMDAMAFSLPDGSRVQMMENSRLSYNRIAWMWNRNVTFDGVARFKVAKGGRFTVSTGFGDVAVLGTEFLVKAGRDLLVVECFSGAVDVTTKVGEQVLNHDEKVECTPQGMKFTPAREVMPGFLEYDHAPLMQVIKKIEELYKVTVTPKDICRNIIYDGLLPTTNLDEALEIVMSSCGMTYSINDDQIIISKYANANSK